MKRYLILLMAFSLIMCSKDEVEDLTPPKDDTVSEGSWKQLNDYPGEGRASGLAFSILGKGYWGFGSTKSASYVRDIWMYDSNTDSWEQRKDFPFDLPAQACVTIKNRAYVITYSGSLYEYDPVPDSWKYLSTFPTGNRPGIVGFALDGNAYFGTGNNVDPANFTVFKDFWKFDPSQNQWTQIDDFPGVARTGAVSFVVGDKAYVGLGSDGQGAPPINKDIWRYDAKTGKWDPMTDFPVTASLVGVLFSNETKAYIGVAENSASHYGQMFEYDPADDSWREIKKYPSGNSLLTNSFTLNDKMFVLGGWWSEYSRQVWEFVP